MQAMIGSSGSVPGRDSVVSAAAAAAWPEETQQRHLSVPVPFAAQRCPWDSRLCFEHIPPLHAPEVTMFAGVLRAGY